MDPFYSKVDNTFERVMADINKFEQVFKQGGKLEQAIMQVGGDPTVLPKIVEALATVYDLLEDGHYDALAHVDSETGERIAGESVTESRKLTEGVLDGDDEDGFMARSQLYFLARDAIKLHGQINDRDNLEPWVQAKITAAAEGIDAVQRYTEYQTMKANMQLPVPAEPMADMRGDDMGSMDLELPAPDAEMEEATNPYAVGMSQAMKSTGDRPPLKKATIRKAHEIAKAVNSTESTFAEEAKFNDKRDGALKSVAQNMFKNALASAKKKAQ